MIRLEFLSSKLAAKFENMITLLHESGTMMQHDSITSRDTLPLPSSLSWMWKITHIWRDSFSAEPTFYLEEGYVRATHQHKAPCSNSWRNRCIEEALVIKLPTHTVERTANIYQQIRRTSPMLPINQGVRMMFQQFSVCLSLSLCLSLVQLEKTRCNQKNGNTIITFCSKKRYTDIPPTKTIQHPTFSTFSSPPNSSSPKKSSPPQKNSISWNLGVLDDLKISSTFLFNSATRAWRLRLPVPFAEAPEEPRAEVGLKGPDGMGPNWRSLGHEGRPWDAGIPPLTCAFACWRCSFH